MLTALENAVVQALLDKFGEPFETLRRQMAHITVAERRFTGVGFFTDFVLAPDVTVRRDLPDTTLGDVGAELPGLLHGAGFVLFVRNGVASMLEGYTYDEPWPSTTDEFTINKLQRG